MGITRLSQTAHVLNLHRLPVSNVDPSPQRHGEALSIRGPLDQTAAMLVQLQGSTGQGRSVSAGQTKPPTHLYNEPS